MTKQLVLINFLKDYINDNSWKLKAEYSTNQDDKKVIVCQERAGNKVVFFGECDPLFNYFTIDIFGESIEEQKNMALLINDLIGTNNKITINNETWQIMVKQLSNFQAIEYYDIRRVGYNATIQCIVSKIL